jgi:hypothetical protein
MAKKKTDAPPDMPLADADLDLSPEGDGGGAGEAASVESKPVASKSKAAKAKSLSVPRVCDSSERATDGLKRFKLRLDGHHSGPRSQRYVLATGRDSAEACYLEYEKIDPKEVDGSAVKLVVTELPD